MATAGQEVIEYQAPDSPVVHEGRGALAQLTQEEFAQKLQALKTERQRIQKIQREVMEEGVDYGVLGGTDKPTLLKPGQEALCDMYGYKVRTEKVRTVGDGVTSPTITWDVRAVVHLGTFKGPEVGDGNGSCNSWEVKYRWRKAGLVCPNCGKEAVIKSTDFTTKQVNGWLCWRKKDGCGTKFRQDDPAITGQTIGKMENEDPWELDNTLLKMAEKRARVDATLSVCAASGLFTQDVGEDEDQPAEADLRASTAETPPGAGQQAPPKASKELQWQSESIGRPSAEGMTYLRGWLSEHGYDEATYRRELGQRRLDGKTLIGVVVQTFPDLTGGAAAAEQETSPGGPDRPATEQAGEQALDAAEQPASYEPTADDLAFYGSRDEAMAAHERESAQTQQPAVAG